MNKVVFSIILILLLKGGVLGQHIYNIKVTDMWKMPLQGASLSVNGKLLAVTDSSGVCKVNCHKDDVLQVSFVGFANLNFNASSLNSQQFNEFLLTSQGVEINEISVVGYPTKKVVKRFHRAHLGFSPYNNWCGKSNYIKTTKENGKYIDYLNQIGFIGGTSTMKPTFENIYYNWKIIFLPEYSKCSDFFVLKNGNHQKLDFRFSREKNFQVHSPLWPRYLRAIQFYGPQLKNHRRHYTYEIVNFNRGIYEINFSSKKKYFPDKIKMKSSGKIFIDCRDWRVVEILFDYCDISNFGPYVFSNFGCENSIVSTIRVQYEIFNEINYPTNVNVVTDWVRKTNDKKCKTFVEYPRYSSNETSFETIEKVELIEVANDLDSISYYNSDLVKAMDFLSYNEMVLYDSSADSSRWNKNFECEKLLQNLSQLNSLDSQYVENNGSFILGQKYIYETMDPKYIDLFMEMWNNSEILFKKLNNLNYEVFD